MESDTLSHSSFCIDCLLKLKLFCRFMAILAATFSESRVAPMKLKVQLPVSSSAEIMLRMSFNLCNLEAFSKLVNGFLLLHVFSFDAR